MNKHDILKLFPVGLTFWITSESSPFAQLYKEKILKQEITAAMAKRLLKVYPMYQHWFMHEGYKQIKSVRLRKKYQFLICPVGNTILPKRIKNGMHGKNMRSVHETLLNYTFMQMHLYDILNDANWKEFVCMLHAYRCYDLLQV